MGKWFGKTKATTPVPPVAPAGSRVYAIGDIHGRADLLASLHRQIEANAAAAPEGRKILVYLGDYVDRGGQSREVVEMLLKPPPPGFERVLLMGNHEALLLRFLETPAIALDWLTYGGDATLFSYGLDLTAFRSSPGWPGKAHLEGLRDRFRRQVPAAHLDFYRNLAFSHVEGDYAFVHAGVRPGRPLDRQTPDDLLWIREPFLSSQDDFGKMVVHGHTIVRAPVVAANRIGIDTGAFASGCLTALVLAGASRSFLET